MMREKVGALSEAAAPLSSQQRLCSAQHLCPTQAAMCAEPCDGRQEACSCQIGDKGQQASGRSNAVRVGSAETGSLTAPKDLAIHSAPLAASQSFQLSYESLTLATNLPCGDVATLWTVPPWFGQFITPHRTAPVAASTRRIFPSQVIWMLERMQASVLLTVVRASASSSASKRFALEALKGL